MGVPKWKGQGFQNGRFFARFWKVPKWKVPKWKVPKWK
jgi:hypothetical protein